MNIPSFAQLAKVLEPRVSASSRSPGPRTKPHHLSASSARATFTDTENRLAVTKGGKERGRTNQELEASGYKPQYEADRQRVLLQGTGGYSQRLAMNLNGKE